MSDKTYIKMLKEDGFQATRDYLQNGKSIEIGNGEYLPAINVKPGKPVDLGNGWIQPVDNDGNLLPAIDINAFDFTSNEHNNFKNNHPNNAAIVSGGEEFKNGKDAANWEVKQLELKGEKERNG